MPPVRFLRFLHICPRGARASRGNTLQTDTDWRLSCRLARRGPGADVALSLSLARSTGPVTFIKCCGPNRLAAPGRNGLCGLLVLLLSPSAYCHVATRLHGSRRNCLRASRAIVPHVKHDRALRYPSSSATRDRDLTGAARSAIRG